jgi:hypothetical protein
MCSSTAIKQKYEETSDKENFIYYDPKISKEKNDNLTTDVFSFGISLL